MHRSHCFPWQQHYSRLFSDAMKFPHNIQRRHKRYVKPSRLTIQIEKRMVRDEKLQRKFYDITEDIASPAKPVIPPPSFKGKELERSIVIREQNISNIIMNEMQNLVDSGAVGVELQNLQITFTKAYMTARNTCRVLWQPELSSKDLKISELLNRSSKHLRHMLMTNHVVNNAPTIHFHLDPDLLRRAKVEELLKGQKLDTGPETGNEKITLFETKTEEVTPSSLCLFGLDYDALYSKLNMLKLNNKVDKG